MEIKRKFKLIPNNEVASEYGISEIGLMRFAFDDMLRPHKIEDSYYWNREDLDSLVNELESKIEVLEARDEYLENNKT